MIESQYRADSTRRSQRSQCSTSDVCIVHDDSRQCFTECCFHRGIESVVDGHQINEGADDTIDRREVFGTHACT